VEEKDPTWTSKYLKMEPVTMTQIHQINDWTNIQVTAYVTSNACISFIKIRPHNDGSSLNYILLGVEGGVFFFFILKFHYYKVWYSYTLPKLATEYFITSCLAPTRIQHFDGCPRKAKSHHLNY